ncbi:MAG TPA: sigma 54-interacting transcriptional regulator [Vicinamibacteria bacterium]|nr:sigma 54-interacting transcriptional regulator [Vicinamibacteria bacterium]
MEPMPATLRILILEDVPTDAELVERELRRGQIEFLSRRVSTRPEFEEQLSSFDPNIILADFSLPGFDGLDALSISAETRPEVPFIFVSGAIGEEKAIETLKKGATDYVLKDRLSRLVPALRRALRETAERSERRRAEAALKHSEQRHRLLLEVNNAIIASLDRKSLFCAITKALSGILSFDQARLTLLDARRDIIQVYAQKDESGVTEAELSREEGAQEHLPGDSTPLVRRDLTRRRGRLSPSEDELLKGGIRAFVSVPLNVKSKAVGFLTVGSRIPDRYRDDDVELLTEVGNQVALAVANLLAYEEISSLKSRLEQENTYLQEEIQTQHDFGEIVGQTEPMAKVIEAIETVAVTDATVLICGETGTGKEVVARAIYDASPQKDKPLVKVNCAALPATLIESELFGHEKGAFTGAIARKIGRFELAHGGTIFLDEIGDLPLELQSKLLRVLQEEEFERVGGSTTIKVNVRVIAATNRDLTKAMEEERFRPDLFYRLAVFPIELPPLRERRSDIPLLANFFARDFGKKLGKSIESISPGAMARLMAYAWPGNIRELKNVIERAAILTRGSQLALDDWWSKPDSSSGPAAPLTLDALQRKHILSVLDVTGWRVSGERGAARLLGIKPTTLMARMKKLGIERPVSVADRNYAENSQASPRDH